MSTCIKFRFTGPIEHNYLISSKLLGLSKWDRWVECFFRARAMSEFKSLEKIRRGFVFCCQFTFKVTDRRLNLGLLGGNLSIELKFNRQKKTIKVRLNFNLHLFGLSRFLKRILIPQLFRFF